MHRSPIPQQGTAAAASRPVRVRRRWRGRRGRWRSPVVALSGAAAVLLVAAACGPVAPAARVDFPDPSVILVNGVYQAFATQNGTGSLHVQHMASADLAHWTRINDAVRQLPSWAKSGSTWAPEVLRLGSQFVLLYTVRHKRLNVQCVSVALSRSAAGPFIDSSTGPVVCQSKVGGSIDPSTVTTSNGSVYLIWKATNSARSATIFAQQLRSDRPALTGPRAALLVPSAAWEGGVVEAPSMIHGPLGYYLFYSANAWNTASYAIGYAVCTTPLGGCRKVTVTAPWLATNPFAAGPGGQSFFRDSSGALRMAYHAWAPDKVSYESGGIRSLWIGHVTFDSAGSPVLAA